VSGHTPGPWTVQGAYIGTDDAHVAQVKGEGRGVTFQRAEANAALIAAAPDLLAVLQDVADFWVGGDVPPELDARMRAAIAKATGVNHEN